MASKSKVFGVDAFISELQQYKNSTETICGRALYEGASIMADKVRSNIKGIPIYDKNTSGKVKGATADEQQAMLDHFGIAKMLNSDGVYDTILGFEGYDNNKTTKYPNGHPVSMIARSIEAGTTWLTKYPFIKPAYNSTKETAQNKMAETVNEQIKEIQNK